MPAVMSTLGHTALILVLAAGLACKRGRGGDGEQADKAGADQPEPAGAARPGPSGERVFRAGDGTPAGQALAVLVAVEVPRLDGQPLCADYALNTRTLFLDLEHQLQRLRGRASGPAGAGVTLDELGRLAAWLDGRAGMLEQIGRAQAMREHELGRANLELTGAFADLSSALAQAYSGLDTEPAPEDALRLGNAADNFAAALRLLGDQCSAPPP